MRAETLKHGWRAVLLGIVLFCANCATLPPPPGADESLGSGEAWSDEPETQTYSAQQSSAFGSREKRPRGRLRRRHAVPVMSDPEATPQDPPTCGGQAVPEGWPDYSSWRDEELLAPFFTCASPAEFLSLQRRVDMPRLLEAVDDWSAVRLGALGPMEARAAQVLQRKRFSFVASATRQYGAYAQVLTLFLVDTAFDDEVRELLWLLARDKQLEQTLGQMEAVREALARRGIKLSNYPEREEQLRDVMRGLGRAVDDVASTIPAADGARGASVYAARAHLPPPYQQAFDETEQALIREHFAPSHVALGTFDSMTFGVPLGFYHLAAGTAHGVTELTEGRYEQATRELAPAALLVGLYAGGKGLRSLSGSKAGVRGLQVPELRLQALKQSVERLQAQLGEEGLGQLARYIQARREAAVLVGAGGEPAAMALHAARGDVARAQAWLSQAKNEPGGSTRPTAGTGKASTSTAAGVDEAVTPKRPGAAGALGSVASLVDESVGHTAEVLHAKLMVAEAEAPGARLPTRVEWLERNRPELEAPPPGVPEGSVLWSEYIAYREGRLSELKAGQRAQGPLPWESYAQLRGGFARGLAFERAMVALLRTDAALPQAQRRWLRDFIAPRIETSVGVAKEGQPGVRFVDALVIESQPLSGQPPRVESFSFKSRDLSLLDDKLLTAWMKADASAALRYYGETLNVRRPSLKYLGSKVQVQRVRLIYEGGALKPQSGDVLQIAVEGVRRAVKGVEVLIP